MKHTKQRYYFSDYSDEDTHPKPRLRLLPSEPIVIKPKGGKTELNTYTDSDSLSSHASEIGQIPFKFPLRIALDIKHWMKTPPAKASATKEAVKPSNPWGGRQFTRLKGYHIGHYLPAKFKKDYVCRDMELGDTLRLRTRHASAHVADKALSPHMVSDMQETLGRINGLLNNLSSKPARGKICSTDVYNTVHNVRRLEKRLEDMKSCVVNEDVISSAVKEVPISVKEISVKDIMVDNQRLSISDTVCLCPMRDVDTPTDSYHTADWVNSTGQFVNTSDILDEAQVDTAHLIHSNTIDLIKNAPVDTTKSSKRHRFATSDSSIRSNLSTLRSRVYSMNSESSFVRGSVNAKMVNERRSNFGSIADLGGGNNETYVKSNLVETDITKNRNPKSGVVGTDKIPKNEKLKNGVEGAHDISGIRAPANIAEVTGMHTIRDFSEGNKGPERKFRGFYDSDLSGLKSYAATGHFF